MTTLKLTSILLSIIFCISTASATPAYTPTDRFLIDCGSSDANSFSQDRGQWLGDELSKYISSQNSPNASFLTKASRRSYVPYDTARVFKAPFTYTFPLSAGPKFVRLFFHAGTYSYSFNITNCNFSMQANNYIFLANFNPYLNLPSNTSNIFFKEFYVNIPDTLLTLNLTFNPNPNSYAFINGIEIISIPNNLYRNDMVYFGVESSGNYFQVVKNNTAMEVVYRFNVGGNDLPVNEDTGMFRSWAQDHDYVAGVTFGNNPQQSLDITYTNVTPAYSAPVNVYTSAITMGTEPSDNMKRNLTWVFPVHAGFMYILRFHFCEFQPQIVAENSRVFGIYMDGILTKERMDVFHEAGGRLIPIYRDFAVLIPGVDGERRDIKLDLHPYIKDIPEFYDAILNGLEIFKVNNSNGSLAGANFNVQPTADPEKKPEPRTRKEPSVGLISGCAVGGGLLGFLVLCVLIFCKRRGRAKDGLSSWVPITLTSNKSTNNTSSKYLYPRLPSHICRRFTFDEIRMATSNFDSSFIIGTGGFGNVYKGYIDEDNTVVAIKRLKTTSKQGIHEFQTEIEMLSKLRHLHLVSLIGYSDDNGEMVLVYEYMSHGTLHDHLYASKNPPLSWKKRLEVCIGAAKGIQYLHTGTKDIIIHRDVKSTNILLDEKWVAKVSDFGLSKTGPTDNNMTHVSTAVKGSFGYLDPEYLRRQQLTEKSDVYSFGVVLLEVLSGRAAVITGLPREQVSLAEWGRQAHKKNKLENIVDSNLIGQIVPECLWKFADIAVGCLNEAGSDRPTMGDVVWVLEFALQLQVSMEKSDVEDDDQKTEALRRGVVVEEGVEDTMRSGCVFSEMSNEIGR